MDKRLEHEIEHGKFLASNGAGEIWNWESPAGKIRWQRRVRMLSDHLTKSDIVLELGCGTGYFTQELAKTGARIIAIDISPDLLEVAKRVVPASNVTFSCINAYQMKLESRQFDFVVGSSVLHHLDIDKALPEIFRVLKPCGKLFFTEPNMLNPQIALQKNIPIIKKWAGDSPDETAFFRWGLKRKMINYGFSNISIEPFDFLHPAIPKKAIGGFSKMGYWLERIPVFKEIAGSLFISGEKSAN